MKIKKGYSLKELMEPTNMVCGWCGDTLYVTPYLSKGKVLTFNHCGNCNGDNPFDKDYEMPIVSIKKEITK